MSDSQTKNVLQGIQQELTDGKKAEAVRLFMEAQSKRLLPRDGDTLQWLVEKMGRNSANKLLEALVHYPCFYCKKGLQPCEACDGAGHFDHETICDQCLAVGLVGCSFCGATAWSPYESVPTGLRYMVFGERAKIAEEQIKTILAKRILAPSADNAVETFKEYVQTLFNLNRQISILENMAAVAPKLLKEYPAFKKQIVKITNTSVTAALNTKKRLKKLIQLMATASKLEAKGFHRDSKMRRFGMGRSEFYVSLLKSAPRFGGTDLEHPFLNKALKRLGQNKRSRKRVR